MAKFKVGDKVRFKDFPSAPGIENKVGKITEVLERGYYRVAFSFVHGGAITMPIEEKWLIAANSAPVCSTNAVVAKALNAARDSATDGVYEKAINDATGRTFKAGDKVRWEYVGGETDSGVVIADKGSYLEVKTDSGEIAHPAKILIAKNDRACNASSSPWGFFVGEEVVIKRDPEKKKHRIKAIVGGDIILEGVEPRFDASELDTANYAWPYRSANSIVQKALNACKNAAAPSAELRRAYDDWQKAKAKFAKWWNPDRRLSERPPAGADEAQKAVAFSNLFLKEVGRRPPNGYGKMTLEQMLAK